MVCTEAYLKIQKKYRDNNKEKIAKRMKIWRANNKDKIRGYNKKHKAAQDQWELDNKERVRETTRLYRLKNIERKKFTDKRWKENNPERMLEIARKFNTKRRRNFGYVPLNKKFPGSVGHHIDRVNILYIPEELHKSIPHKQGEVSMNNINRVSLEWYFTQNTIVNRPNLEGDVF